MPTKIPATTLAMTSLLVLVSCGSVSQSRADGSPGTGGGGGSGGTGGQADAADGPGADSGADVPPAPQSCAAFSQAADGWAVATGYRAVVVAVGAPLSAPAALTFVGGDFGNTAMVTDLNALSVFKLDLQHGTVSSFVSGAQWPRTPTYLAELVWDAGHAFDGKLYVADRGSTADQNSTIFRVGADGVASILTSAPGIALDDVYSMAFSPGGAYSPGLYIGGDTDDTTMAGWARVDSNGTTIQFSLLSGADGADVDRLNRFGGGLFAAMPMGSGWEGDGSISRMNPDGSKATPLISSLPDIGGLTFAPAGPFGGDAFAVRRATGTLLRVAPGGVMAQVATGLSMVSSAGNNLAFSPDGQILLVSETDKARIVCVEPSP
jgi:hypothetical protein